MQQTVSARIPAHLWIVGVLSLFWNSFGAYDYLMTKTRGAAYIASTMPGTDANAAMSWINEMPLYAQVGWAVGVWFALLGSLMLLMRSRLAVWWFGLSLLGALVSLGYQLALAPPMPGATAGPVTKVMPFIILLVAFGLFIYVRAIEKRGILR